MSDGARKPLEPMVRDVGELLRRAGTVELKVPHDTGLLSVEPAQVTRILALLDDASAFLRRVLGHFESTSGEDPTAAGESAAEEQDAEEQDRDATAGRGTADLSPRQLADVAFVGRLELEQLRDTLHAGAGSGHMWRVVSDADRAIARTIRSLSPIEGALRKMVGLPPLERRWFDLDDALTSRKRYAEFYLDTVRAGDPAPDLLDERLDVLAAKIETLRNDAIYPFLRVDDRLGLRALQKRVAKYLVSEPRETTGAVRLWQDAAGFFQLLMQISRREELVHHDLHLAARLCAELGDADGVPVDLPQTIHRRLRHFAGQDPELDRMLVRDTPGRASDYVEPLARVRDRLVAR